MNNQKGYVIAALIVATIGGIMVGIREVSFFSGIGFFVIMCGLAWIVGQFRL
ncbi:MAG: hypothetical protein OXH90_08350 [Paracoccaceae bacterium]|nr:hypothetical protein [Paracoccaceae bacterium]MDE2915675.1 hypothetical protein [Paracoccaceae bacterium]